MNQDTDRIPIKRPCEEHSGIIHRVKRNESDIQGLWKEIDSMKRWVIVGMSAVILQLCLYVGTLVS